MRFGISQIPRNKNCGVFPVFLLSDAAPINTGTAQMYHDYKISHY